ncbi:MAG TPA: inorganic diphosphatase [Methylocella sp.]|nr:inorganic diphosphatase [Methylocella sp.]
MRQFEHFFARCKDLEPGKWVKIECWGDADKARRIVSEAIERRPSIKN